MYDGARVGGGDGVCGADVSVRESEYVSRIARESGRERLAVTNGAKGRAGKGGGEREAGGYQGWKVKRRTNALKDARR